MIVVTQLLHLAEYAIKRNAKAIAKQTNKQSIPAPPPPPLIHV